MLEKIHQLHGVHAALVALLLGFFSSVGFAQGQSASFPELLFKEREYLRAIIYLEKQANLSASDTNLLAESLYAVGRLKEAREYFLKLLSTSQDQVERQRLEQRIFSIYIRLNDFDAAKKSFAAYQNNYQIIPPMMQYAMGKMFFDYQYYVAAKDIFNLIPKNNEFFIRARYLLASISIDRNSLKSSIALYKEIEEAPTVSVEDYTIKQMAIMAQARLYADGRRDDIAADVYEKVDVAGAMGDKATAELIKILLTRAEMARNGEGKFASLGLVQRENIEKEAVARGYRALARYRKFSSVDWQKPELAVVMAELYVKNKRYAEARLFYDSFIGHYRTLYTELQKVDQSSVVWPYFKINARENFVIEGVPSSLVQKIPELSAALALKKHIEENARIIERISELDGKRGSALKFEQQETVRAYEALIVSLQRTIKKAVATIINDRVLAEVEFKRAELALAEMEDLKKQLDANRQFQTNTVNEFDSKLPKLEGGSL